MSDTQFEIWDLWYPGAAATGLPFARGRMDPTNVLYVHAAPDTLSVRVQRNDGTVVARGQDLKRTLPEYSPMTKLTREGDRILRQDLWVTSADLEKPVILPGGEVGTIKAWWNAPDHSEWRWQVEFYNHR